VSQPGHSVIVEFSSREGVTHPEPIALLTRADLAGRSKAAVDVAMLTIRTMSDHFIATISALARTPAEVDLEFGINFDAEVGAVVTKAHTGASLAVTLKWKMEPAASNTE
jgi:Trypsin-co-occurring domain 1